MRLLPGYEMASNAQPYIVITALFYTARMGQGLQKTCADLGDAKNFIGYFLSIRKEKKSGFAPQGLRRDTLRLPKSGE